MTKTKIKRMTSRTNHLKPDGPITKAVIRLGKLCGMNYSESGSEAFVQQLHRCVTDTMQDIDESHGEGLCLDACRALGSRLEEL